MAKQPRAGLGLWDRLVLLVAWVVTCGLVYVLGFYVGKGTQEHRIGLEERVVKLPVTSKPPPEGQRPQADSDLTFYDTLAAGDPERDAARPAQTPPAAHLPVAQMTSAPPAATAPAAHPATAPTPAHPTAASAGAPKAHPPAAHPAVAATAPATVAHPAVGSEVPVVRPAVSPAVATAPTQLPPAAVAPPAAPRPTTGGWTVQANPTRDRDEAETLYRQLHSRGYDATVVRVVRDGDTWYRVQVGRFATSEQATETMQRLREHEGVAHVFVASE